MTGSRIFKFGCAMSILARSVRDPSANSPERIRRRSSSDSSDDRFRYGLSFPGCVRVPLDSRSSSALRSQTNAFPFPISRTA